MESLATTSQWTTYTTEQWSHSKQLEVSCLQMIPQNDVKGGDEALH